GQYLFVFYHRAVGCCGTTATWGALEEAKQKLREFYFEQLLLRPKPENRTQKGWQNILESARLSLEPKLDRLSRIEDVFALAEKCLNKNQSILEDFRFIATDNVFCEAVEWSAQENFVHATEEGKTFERDLEILSRLDEGKNSRSGVFEQSLEPQSEPLDLIETSEPTPKRLKFEILEALGNMVMQGQEQNRSFMGLFQSMSIEQQRQSEELKEAVTHLGSRKEAPTGWTKFIPRPDPFKPKDREEELTQWQDWSWSFKQWILAISPEMYTAIEEVEQDLSSPCEEATMTDDAILQGKQLYAILTSMLRERPLQILKSVTGANGFETWRVLNNVLAPTNKTRALALLGAISQFPAMNQGNLLEQVLRLEDLFRKYEQASGKPVPNEMQSAILLRVLPQQVRSHLTITIGDDSTYESMRDMILRWERSTQKWSSQIVTGGAPQKPSYDDPNGPSPMDVDRVKGWPKGKGRWGKGAGKGSGKDGGKYGGKNGKGKGGKGGYESRPGKGKGYEKGGKGKQSSWSRNDWSKGGKDRGKKGGKGKERLSHDACRICGKSGHWGNECWMKDKVRNINQNDTSSASGNSSSASSSNSSTGTASVKRVFDLADSDRLDVPMTTGCL
ncbi:unnamed protein product, partial [Symbiodinium natans]